MYNKKNEEDGDMSDFGGMMVSGGGISAGDLPIFWFVVYRYKSEQFELWYIDHFDQESATSKMIWGRVNAHNGRDYKDTPARLVRACTAKENDWLNNFKKIDSQAFDRFMKDPDKWPLYDFTQYLAKPKLHELHELSLHPQV